VLLCPVSGALPGSRSPHYDVETPSTAAWKGARFATRAKLFNPDLTVMVVKRRRRPSSIGGNHLIHAARRDIDIKVICANNMIYGMTGGQVARQHPWEKRRPPRSRAIPSGPSICPASLVGAGASYVAKYSVTQPVALINSIKTAIQHVGFSFIEVLSPCRPSLEGRNRSTSPKTWCATSWTDACSRKGGGNE